MKKFRIVMGALAFAVVVATVIACSKEKAENKTFAETETISKEDDMSAYLKQFKGLTVMSIPPVFVRKT